MYKALAIGLVILGLVLLFSVDTLISADTTNSTLSMVYQNHQVTGAVCVIAGYYVYMTYCQHDESHQIPMQVEH